jgi:hypothetical protein
MRGGEGGGDLRADPHRVPGQHRAVDQPLLERVATNKLHHDIRRDLPVDVGFAEVVNLSDVRVREGGRGLRLPPDPVPRLRGVGRVRGQDLHRHGTGEYVVVRLPHDGHATDADLGDQPIATAEHPAGAGVVVGAGRQPIAVHRR